MGGFARFEEIGAWKKARELVGEVYAVSARGPWARDFGLQDQIRRAAVSCMSNIAEGFARNGDREFARYLDMTRGSAAEVRSLLYVALDLGYLEEPEFQTLHALSEEVTKMTAGLTAYLRKRR